MRQLFPESASGILAKGAVHRMERTKQKPVHVALDKKGGCPLNLHLNRNVYAIASIFILICLFFVFI